MLTSEEQLNASDEVLISSPIDGIGYQLASALTRLGRKMTGLFDSQAALESISPLKLRCVEYSFTKPIEFSGNPLSGDNFPLKNFVLSFNQALSKNEIPEREILSAAHDLSQNLIRKNPDLHFIAIFPNSVPEKIVTDFFNLAPAQSTFFRVPALLGMRDSFIFDFLMSLDSSQISRLKKEFSHDYQVPLAFVADVVGFVVSAIAKPEYKNKIITAPANFSGPAELAHYFETQQTHLQAAIQAIKDITSLLDKNPLEAFLLKNHFPQTQGSAVFSTPEIKALDIFPTKMTPAARLIKQSFDLKQRFPELNSHFPPSRSL